jgi:predicted transcriptional regulator
MRKPSPKRPRVYPNSAAARLRARVAADPDYPERYTQPEIAAEFGISQQRVHQILGPVGRRRHEISTGRLRDRLAKFVEDHPQAVRLRRDGGMSPAQIAAEIGLSTAAVRKYWMQLNLPSRTPHPLGRREVLRREICVECGATFDWTLLRERNFRTGPQKFKVCSTRCGTRHGRKSRQAQR